MNLSAQKKINPPIKFAIIVGIIGDSATPINFKTNAKIGVESCHLSKYKKYCKNSFLMMQKRIRKKKTLTDPVFINLKYLFF